MPAQVYTKQDNLWVRMHGVGPEEMAITTPDRSDLEALYGTYEPEERVTAGLLPGVALTKVTGAQTLAPGTYVDKWYRNKVTCAATGTYVFRNCRFDGPNIAPRTADDNSDACFSAVHPDVTDIRIYDSLIKADPPSNATDGIRGHHLTLERCHIRHASDGIRLSISPTADIVTTIKGCVIEDLVYWRPSQVSGAPRSEGTHNDAVTIEGGSNIEIIGNRFDGYLAGGKGERALHPSYPSIVADSAVYIEPVVAVSDVTIENNWVYGFATPIRVTEGGLGGVTGTISGNRFDRGARSGMQISLPMATQGTMQRVGNVFMDNGTTVLENSS